MGAALPSPVHPPTSRRGMVCPTARALLARFGGSAGGGGRERPGPRWVFRSERGGIAGRGEAPAAAVRDHVGGRRGGAESPGGDVQRRQVLRGGRHRPQGTGSSLQMIPAFPFVSPDSRRGGHCGIVRLPRAGSRLAPPHGERAGVGGERAPEGP